MIEVVRIEAFNPATSQIETLCFTSAEDYYHDGEVYLPLISEKFFYSEHLFEKGQTSGEATIGTGTIVVGNVNGVLDKYKEYAFDGRTVSVYRLESKDEPLSTANLYFTGTIEFPDFGWDEITWHIKSRMEVLNVQMQVETFEGTNSGTGGDGGFEGSEGVKGVIKPQLFGRCMNVEGVPVNEFWLMYAFNYDREGNRKPIYRFYSVYVKGIQYLYSDDYSSAENLRTATIPAGYYATCNSEGLIRLGSVPADNGKVVVNCADAPESECKAGAVVRRILEDNAGLVAGMDFDANGLSILDDFNGCPVGYYVTGTESIASVISQVIDSVGGWFVPDPMGVFQFGLIDRPSVLEELGQTSIATITSYQWGDTIECVAVGDESRNIPAYSVRLAHTRNWSPQDSGDLADAVSLSARTFFSNEYRYEKESIGVILTRHPLAPSLEFETVLNSQLYFSVYNSDFSLPISEDDWVFIGEGTADQEDGAITVSPSKSTVVSIQQNLLMNGQVFAGETELQVTVKATDSVVVRVEIHGGGATLLEQSVTAGSSDETFLLHVTIPSSDEFASLDLTFETTSSTTNFTISNVSWRLEQQGMSPRDECIRRLEKESSFIERYNLDVTQEFCRKYGIGPGKIVTLKDDRFGLQDGKDFLVIGVDQDGDELITTLDVWG